MVATEMTMTMSTCLPPRRGNECVCNVAAKTTPWVHGATQHTTISCTVFFSPIGKMWGIFA